MRELRCDVAVIGAGTAGLNACKAATANGANTLLIERGPGGSTCTRVGCMPSKLLIAAGRAAADARAADRFGIRVSGVAVDGGAVLARLRRERDRFVASVMDEYLAIPEEKRIHGSARFVGPDRLQVGDDLLIHAGAIVIAAGAHPSVPEALDPVRACVHTHETIFEIEALPRRLAVVGTGPLGLELAQAFARLGVEVTALGEEKQVGRLADPQAEQAARDALSRDLALHLGVEVTAEMGPDNKPLLRWTGDSAGEVTVDMVLAAAGRPPNLSDLALDAAGIELDDKGVPVFDHRTHRCGNSAIFIGLGACFIFNRDGCDVHLVRVRQQADHVVFTFGDQQVLAKGPASAAFKIDFAPDDIFDAAVDGHRITGGQHTHNRVVDGRAAADAQFHIGAGFGGLGIAGRTDQDCNSGGGSQNFVLHLVSFHSA